MISGSGGSSDAVITGLAVHCVGARAAASVYPVIAVTSQDAVRAPSERVGLRCVLCGIGSGPQGRAGGLIVCALWSQSRIL